MKPPNKNLPTKPVVAQLKSRVAAQSSKRATPLAPPVYRPEARKIVQPKLISPPRTSTPVASRPDQKSTVQAKMTSQTPKAPPAYQPQPVPQVMRGGAGAVQRKPVAHSTPTLKPTALNRPLMAAKVLQKKTIAASKSLPQRTSAPTSNVRMTIIARRAPKAVQLKSQVPRLNRGNVLQLVNAYRVEGDAKNPKLQVNDAGRVTGFLDDKFGINISFVQSSHADYYLATKGEDAIMYEFEVDDKLWAAIQKRRDKKKTGDKDLDKLVATACTDPKVPNKENAIYLESGWFPYLKKAIGRVRVSRPGEDVDAAAGSDVVWAYWLDDEGTYEDGQEMSKSDAEAAGFKFMSLAESKRKSLWHEA